MAQVRDGERKRCAALVRGELEQLHLSMIKPCPGDWPLVNVHAALKMLERILAGIEENAPAPEPALRLMETERCAQIAIRQETFWSESAKVSSSDFAAALMEARADTARTIYALIRPLGPALRLDASEPL